MLCGALGKKTLGAGNKKGLFYALIKDASSAVAAQIMARFAKLSSKWISNYGMSFGIGDVTPSDHVIALGKTETFRTQTNCEIMIRESKDRFNLENKILDQLNKVKKDVGNQCIKELPKTNCAVIMAVCGAKGDNNNLNQMMVFLG